ncbi:DNA polymerase III subunit alpha [Streptobacillus moniliformis]|uniref:DNA polymerase III subunit alpha n=1 Tax=Streptobacillus moniliformis TaxID=34105 RepID=UPI0007E3D3B5|nr:DNA polymerase III subunit alpha [Streptobacillus moniliformis]
MLRRIHTEYSLLEGVGSVEEYVQKARENNIKELAITDFGMFAAIKFYNSCKSNNIVPIIGIEIHLKGFLDQENIYTLTLLAKNEKGVKDIYKLSTISYERKEYERNYILLDDLLEHSKDIYILSGGVNSELVSYVLKNDYKKVKKLMEIMLEKLDIILEIPMFEMLEYQRLMFDKLVDELNVKSIEVNEIYYLEKEDKILQKIFAAIKENRTLKTVQNEKKQDRLHFIINNENKREDILNDIDIVLDNKNVEFPLVKLPYGLSEKEYIINILEKNIGKKYPNITKEIQDRINYELNVIDKMGYIKYFLIVHDFIKYAKENDIFIGPGRGSAAGSIISYLLGITELDPIKYGLIFERFLNPERISMPDIDVDIEQEKRIDLIEYIKRTYGSRNVSQIITFSTFKPTLALKDLARVFEIPEKSIRKLLDESKEKSLDELSDSKEMVKSLIDYAKRIEGKIKNSSTHAAGVIITKEDMRENLPLIYDSYTKDYQIQFEANVLESLGYLKMDLLGLKNLNVVKNVIKKVNEDIDIYNLPEYEEAFNLLNTGNTIGIFQCESRGITQLAMNLKIHSLEDIALLLALYRPGPLESGLIPSLIVMKNNKNIKIKTVDPMIEDILLPTYGVLVYQEQVMEIAQKISGYSLAKADELRKAIGKKNVELLKQNRKDFIENAIIPKQRAEKIYDLIDNFGNYGFNKAHAISYANITYQTAYLKAKYPREFFASLLTTELKVEKKLVNSYAEMLKRNIEMYPPSINRSTAEFEIEENGIRIPLSALKEMSEKTAREVVEEREKNGNFKDIFDFITRCRFLNKSNLEGLIYSGCFDEFNIGRKKLIVNLQDIIKWIDKRNKSQTDIYSSLFLNMNMEIEEYKWMETDEMSDDEIIKLEKEYVKLSMRNTQILKSELVYNIFKSNEYVIGYIESEKSKVTKKNELMNIVNILSIEGSKEYLIFPKEYMRFSKVIQKGNIICFKSNRVENNKYNIVNAFKINDFSKYNISVKINEDFEYKEEFKKYILEHRGNDILNIYFGEKNKKNIKQINLNKEFIKKMMAFLGKENVRLQIKT